MPDHLTPSDLQTDTFLIGAGVVGRAILRAHIDASISACIVDSDRAALESTASELQLSDGNWNVSPLLSLGSELSAVEFIHTGRSVEKGPPIVIESIAERLEIKRAFFAKAESLFGDEAVLCSNTSTLRISDIATELSRPERFCGMHFFMPVDQRNAIEIVRGEKTSTATIDLVCRHALRLAKKPLVVKDSAGFIVNRLLSPYLNESMLLLGRGIDAEQIERAALAYGMPISPLELIDWIGTRTVFDAGRVFWQAFPDRISPSPIAPALLKRMRFGRSGGGGFYDYENGVRSAKLAPEVIDLTNRYVRDQVKLADQEVLELLSIPMWIEAALACRDGVVTAAEQLEIAMQGGLGFDANHSWLGFFDSLTSETILRASKKWSAQSASMRLPTWIAELLTESSPGEAIMQCVR